MVVVFTAFTLFLLFTAKSWAQSTYCSPNSLPRTCGGFQVCTIQGNCGFLQETSCCNSSLGYPTNTPAPSITVIPTPTNLPTFAPPVSPTPTVYVGSLTPWYTQNLSTTGELIEKSLPDLTGQYLYIVGRKNHGENGGGWSESGIGFIRKVKISNKSVQWTKNIGTYLGYYTGGFYDVAEDGSGLYVTGYTEWGSKMYNAKLNTSTGAVIWEKTETVAPTTAWNHTRAVAVEMDSTYLFVGGSDFPTSGTSPSERWVVYRKLKSDGTTDLTRRSNLSSGIDAVKDIKLSGAYIIAAGEKNGSWYFEKITKSNLAVSVNTTGVSGSPSTHSMVIDGSYLYVSGIQTVAPGRGVLRVEKRNISDLALVWSYTAPDGGNYNINAHTVVFEGQILTVVNETIVGGYATDVRIMFLSTQNGTPTKNSLYNNVGHVGALDLSTAGQLYLAGATPLEANGAVYIINEQTYTPTPTPTVPTFTGCNITNWTNTYNVSVTENSFVGTTYTEWNFANGADADVIAQRGETLGGYVEIPPTNPNYGAMWGISAISAGAEWIDYSWYAPFYSGNDIYISLPGKAMISMGSANPGDRFGVRFESNTMIFTKLLAGSTTWQTMYIFADVAPDVLTEATQFRARVAGYSHIYRSFVGTSCAMVALATPTPIPTGPVGGALSPWYSVDLSSFPEVSTQVAEDSTGQYVYVTGKKNIGSPFGWGQSGTGWIQKIRKSDKQVVWSYTMSSNHSALYDAEEDGAHVYITGYSFWGTNLYTAKLSSDTGQKIWEKEDSLGWSWFPYKGVSFGMDDEYLYIASNGTNNDFDTNFSIVKKSKTTGDTVASRVVDFSNDWDAVTNVLVSGGSVYVAGYQSYTTPKWYLEKLSSQDLSLQTSITSVSGVIDMHGMKIDETYLYLGGFQMTQGTTMQSSNLRTRVYVEKRRLTDLSLVWSFGFPLDHRWQGSTGITIHGNEILATANDTMDRVGWFGSSWVGQNLRFIRINKNNGGMIHTMAYSGVGNVGGTIQDDSGEIFLAAATTNRALSAIFRLNDLITIAPPFGLTVSQTLLTPSLVRGGPIQLRVDIANSPNATEAAWAFSFFDQVPTSIVGVVWDCEVVETGVSTGDMAAYPTRCGTSASGAGNTIHFSHSSVADPLIHPGGKLSVTISGVLAPNAPSTILNTASISSYPGWESNHYYSSNFISSPTDYVTLADNDPTDNTSTLTITVPTVPTPTGIPQGPSACGKALYFQSPRNQYVELPHEQEYDFTNGDTISIEAWIYPTDIFANRTGVALNNRDIIVAKGQDESARNFEFSIAGSGEGVGKLWFGYRNPLPSVFQSYTTNQSVISNNNWYHVVVTYTYGTPSSMKLYVNGQLIPGAWTGGTGSVSPVTNNNAVRIGAEVGSGMNERFDGIIDEVRIYNTALTQTDVTAHYNSGNGIYLDKTSSPSPIGGWHLEEGVGSIAHDMACVDQSEDGTIINSPTWVAGRVNPPMCPPPSTTSYCLVTSPTPTPIPIPYIPSCLDQNQILRTYVDGVEQYYCEDNDPSGHNLIMVTQGVIKTLNSSLTRVEGVEFIKKPSVNDEELVTVKFTLHMRKPGTGSQSREYSMTVRLH